MDAFQVANAHSLAQRADSQTMFECKTISLSKGAVKTSGGVVLNPDLSIDQAGELDFVYVPAFFYQGEEAFDKMLVKLKPVIDWLVLTWKSRTVIASSCTGTFLLAETGLLEGRKATTTWWLEQVFRDRYPKVRLNMKEMVTEQDALICAGAMTANLSIAMSVIERFVSSDIAMHCAKSMLVDTSDTIQSPYHNLLVSESSSDPIVSKAQFWIQNHLHIVVDQIRLAEKVGVSQRTLIRHFKAELGTTPLTYLQNVRIETAKQILENTSLSLEQVIYQVGYRDISSFAKLFKKRVGVTPSVYRKRFAKS